MITKDEFNKIAECALLNFTERETNEMIKDMSDVISFVNSVKEAYTDKPNYRNDKITVDELREDIPGECTPVDVLLSNAGGGEDGFFTIKRRGKNE